MKKVCSIIMISLMFSLSFPSQARADFEGIQGVLNAIKVVVEKATNIVKEVQKQVRAITEQVNGIAGAYKEAKAKFENAKQTVQNAKDKVERTKNAIANFDGSLASIRSLNIQLGTIEIPSILGKNLADSKGNLDENKLADAVKENYLAKFGEGDDVEVHTNKDAQMNVVQRNNIASLYALGLSTRTTLKREQKLVEEAVEKKTESDEETESRKLVQETREQSMKSAERFARIMLLESAIYEFRATQKSTTQKTTTEGAE